MRGDRVRLIDIRDAAERINRYVVYGRERFESDELVQTWVLHHLQIIGEAARALSPGFRASSPQIPWAAIIGLRTILVHHYFQIDIEAAWVAASRDVPALGTEIAALLSALPPD